MRSFACLLVMLACSGGLSGQEIRTWTDAQGRKMEAQFVREVDGDVTFIRGGKLITFPLEQLSEADQKFIRDAEAGKKVEEAAVPAGAPRKDAGLDSPALPLDSSPAADTKSSLIKQRQAAEERTWRDVFGKQTVGTFVRIHQGNVVLLRGGRVTTIPYYRLSRADRDYLRDLLSTRGEASQIPPDTPEPPPVAAEPPGPAPASGPAAELPGPERYGVRPVPPPTPIEAPSEQPVADDRVASNFVPPASVDSNSSANISDRSEPSLDGFKVASGPPRTRQREFNLLAFVIGLPLGALIGSLIGAVILRAAVSLALGENIAYGDAYVTMFVASLVNGAVGLAAGFAYGAINGTDEGSLTLSIILLPVGYLVQSGVISSKLDMDFGSACKVTLTMYAISFAIALVFVGIIFVVFQATR